MAGQQQEEIETIRSRTIEVKLSDADVKRICISSSVFPKNRKEKFPILGMGYSHISAGNIFI